MMKYNFGEKIRTVRERSGLTLKTIAEKAQVSESLVSQIERNKISPSIDTLLAITDALEIDLDWLLSGFKKDRAVNIIKADSRSVLVSENFREEKLSVIEDKNDNHSIEAVYLTIKSGSEKGDKEYGHEGKEMGIILEGSCELSYGGNCYKLEKGDSISFPANIPHVLKNTGMEELKTIWIRTPGRK
jgi:transcriptional regulator with XRE-family HTH domain